MRRRVKPTDLVDRLEKAIRACAKTDVPWFSLADEASAARKAVLTAIKKNSRANRISAAERRVVEAAMAMHIAETDKATDAAYERLNAALNALQCAKGGGNG